MKDGSIGRAAASGLLALTALLVALGSVEAAGLRSVLLSCLCTIFCGTLSSRP